MLVTISFSDAVVIDPACAKVKLRKDVQNRMHKVFVHQDRSAALTMTRIIELGLEQLEKEMAEADENDNEHDEKMSISKTIQQKINKWLTTAWADMKKNCPVQLPTLSEIGDIDYWVWLEGMDVNSWIGGLGLREVKRISNNFEKIVENYLGQDCYEHYTRAARLDAKLLFELDIVKDPICGGVDLSLVKRS